MFSQTVGGQGVVGREGIFICPHTSLYCPHHHSHPETVGTDKRSIHIPADNLGLLVGNVSKLWSMGQIQPLTCFCK